MCSFPPFSLMLKLPWLSLSKHLGMHRVTKCGKGLREVKCVSVKRTGERIIVYTCINLAGQLLLYLYFMYPKAFFCNIRVKFIMK